MFEDDVVAMMPRIRSYARKLTGNNADADDLTQTTILKALSRKHQFIPNTNVVAWVLTIMHHQHISDVRQAVNHSNSLLLDGINLFPVRKYDAEMNILVREVAEEFERLSPQTRRIIEGITTGLSYNEVGKRENIPVGTVRSRLSRGRAKLCKFAEGLENVGRYR